MSSPLYELMHAQYEAAEIDAAADMEPVWVLLGNIEDSPPNDWV